MGGRALCARLVAAVECDCLWMIHAERARSQLLCRPLPLRQGCLPLPQVRGRLRHDGFPQALPRLAESTLQAASMKQCVRPHNLGQAPELLQSLHRFPSYYEKHRGTAKPRFEVVHQLHDDVKIGKNAGPLTCTAAPDYTLTERHGCLGDAPAARTRCWLPGRMAAGAKQQPAQPPGQHCASARLTADPPAQQLSGAAHPARRSAANTFFQPQDTRSFCL